MLSADKFDLAMQLLTQQFGGFTELQLLGGAIVDHSSSGNGSRSAFTYTLQPLQHLITRLEIIVIDGINVSNMASLQQQQQQQLGVSVGELDVRC